MFTFKLRVNLSYFITNKNPNSNNTKNGIIPLSSVPPHKNDIVSDIHNNMSLRNKIYAAPNTSSIPSLSMITVPNNKFIDTLGGNYPDKTFILCWWCSSSFNTPPIGIPIKVEENLIHTHQPQPPNNESSITPLNFVMHGFFCSFECAKAYLIEEKNNPLYTVRGSEELLNLLYKRTFNKIPNIIPAADWRSLNIYSGDPTMDNLTFKQCHTPFVKTPYVYLTPGGQYL